jgi:hypothetical protein
MAQQTLVGQGHLIIKASKSHSDTPQPVGLLWTSDQPNSTPASGRPHTHALGRRPLGSASSCINPLMPELNPSAQRWLTRVFTGDFASWTVHFVNICVKNQQIQQLFIQFINYVWYLLHVSALHCHPQGAFLVPSERCSIEEKSIEYCVWACCV